MKYKLAAVASVLLVPFLMGLGYTPPNCCQDGRYTEARVLGSRGNDYLGLGWGASEANRFLNLNPSALIFVGNSLTNQPVNQDTRSRSENIAVLDEVQTSSLPNLGEDAPVCATMGIAKFRVNRGDTVPEQLDSTVPFGPLAGTASSNFTWTEDLLLKIPAEDWNTHMARWPSPSTCGAAIDQEWLDGQLYNDPAANNWCGDDGDSDTQPDNDPPTRPNVPLPTGGPDTRDAGAYQIRAFWWDLRKESARAYTVQRVMEQMADVGPPACMLTLGGKVGSFRHLTNAEQFGEDEGRHAECSFPSASGMWIGPAIPDAAEVCPGSPDPFDPSCNCTGLAGPLAPTPYAPGEFRASFRAVAQVLLDEMVASATHSDIDMLVQQRPGSERKWIMMSDIFRESPLTILGETTYPWSPGGDPLAPR